MLKSFYTLGVTSIEPPINAPGAEIELNFDVDDPASVQVKVSNDWDFGNIPSQIILKHIAGGNSGGPGIYEGLPIKWDIEDKNGRINILDHYLDLTNPDTLIDCDRIIATSRARGGIDWLNDITNNVYYNILLKNGTITSNDYIQVPYVISGIPDYKETAIAILTAYAILSTLRDMRKEMLKVIADISSITSAIAGILKALILIVWIIATLLVIIQLIINIKDTLIQSIKYHAGMRLQRLLEAGATAIGLKFVSTIFNDPIYRDTIIIPAKFETLDDISDLDNRGFSKPTTKSNGYFDGSYRELLAISKDMFNAKLVIIGKELHLERKDTNVAQAKYKLPDIKLEPFRNNANELIANYAIEFRVDERDENTIDQYKGTITNVLTQPKKIVNSDMVLMKGAKTVSIPFALVKRKKTLTRVEKMMDNLFKDYPILVNAVVLVLNAIIVIRNRIIKRIKKFLKRLKTIGIKIQFKPKPLKQIPFVNAQTIEQRINMMLLSSDDFQVPKIGTFDISNETTKKEKSTDAVSIWNNLLNNIVSGTTLARQTKAKETNDTDWAADTLYEKFHFINSHAPSSGNPKGNQWDRHEVLIPHFCKEDLLKINNNNNVIFTHDGRVAKIETLTWNLHDEVASGTIRIHQTYTKNLTTKTVTPDGF